ncbi:flavin reductase family protein [Paenibacillus septentrionalis]|uniref:Flavin reductase family protein n=1 Tax=Paenibacillus septentrionalis TaxID=429342 RepID=A0ABW1V332_9BACL
MIEATVWRQTMGKFATGVTVITTLDADGNPLGMTANAFTSLSLTPPMVLICVDNSSTTLAQLIGSRKFCVNILSSDQEAISRQFAKKGGPEKFEGVSYSSGLLGLPVLEGCLTSVECELSERYEGGDHMILLGSALHIYQAPYPAEPLIFYEGKYRSLVEMEATAP